MTVAALWTRDRRFYHAEVINLPRAEGEYLRHIFFESDIVCEFMVFDITVSF